MHRTFVEALPRVGEQAVIAGDEAHHFARVKRGRVGERLLLFDGRGGESWAEVTSVGRSEVAARVLADSTPRRQPSVAVTLAVAPPKGKRLALLLEKATELGAHAIGFIGTERGVVDASIRHEAKAGRWRQATIEAAKQCGVLTLPELLEPVPLAERLPLLDGPVFLLDPGDGAARLSESCERAPERASLLVGPEGGFTSQERAAAVGLGAIPIRIGATTLRIETAAIAGLAAIRAVWG